jgi:hypothetical protein
MVSAMPCTSRSLKKLLSRRSPWKRSKYCGLTGVVGLIQLWVGLRFLLVRLLSGGLGLGVKNIWALEREEGLF